MIFEGWYLVEPYFVTGIIQSSRCLLVERIIFQVISHLDIKKGQKLLNERV
jgi:hypothetical protein